MSNPSPPVAGAPDLPDPPLVAHSEGHPGDQGQAPPHLLAPLPTRPFAVDFLRRMRVQSSLILNWTFRDLDLSSFQLRRCASRDLIISVVCGAALVDPVIL